MRDQTEVRPRSETEGGTRSGWRATFKDTGVDPFGALARADHALLVTRQIKGGKVRRRIMLSLDAAQRAAARADAAGQPATITLVRLQPVGHVDLDDLELGGDRL